MDGIAVKTPGRVLVVEDSLSVSELLTERIGELTGACCELASSLRQARSLLESDSPAFDVAVVDLNLPDAPDGEVLTSVLKAGIPAIVLSSSAREKTRVRALAAGASDYVSKDTFGVDYVARQIRRMLQAEQNKILVVDDSLSFRKHLSTLLRQHGYQTVLAADGLEGVERVKQDATISMVITDYHMPRMDGLRMTVALRRLRSFEHLSIIALSSDETPEVLGRFLRSGASDYLYKSFSTEELFCRVDQNMDMLLSLSAARFASDHDYLTGLLNRRSFMASATALFDKARRESGHLLVAIADADNFKRVNDRFGHYVGDRVLVGLAEHLRAGVDGQGLAARLGGEEFALLQRVDGRDHALGVLENLRQKIAASPIHHGTRTVDYTVSIGATLDPAKGLEGMLARADTALYRAKNEGRNRVVID
jgi:diguanylate cyclase (GGDEF)-like protein